MATVIAKSAKNQFPAYVGQLWSMSQSSIYGQWSETTLIRLDRCLPELIAFVLGGSDLGELRRSRTIVHIYYSNMHSPADYI